MVAKLIFAEVKPIQPANVELNDVAFVAVSNKSVEIEGPILLQL